MAAPFVEGRLRNQPVSATIQTSCGHCGQAAEFVLDSELTIRAGKAPGLLFHPTIDWSSFDEPNIIHGF